jgi:hypothetical protein
VGDETNVTIDQVKQMTEAVDLFLPQDALEKLAHDYAQFLAGFEAVRKIRVADREPPALVPTLETDR